jgi:hypothetical protein
MRMVMMLKKNKILYRLKRLRLDAKKLLRKNLSVIIFTEGFLLGVALMVTDELFEAIPDTYKYRYNFPILGWFDIWSAWSIVFVWIFVTVIFTIITTKFEFSKGLNISETINKGD